MENITSQKTTDQQYDQIVMEARDLFVKKQEDYGLSWRVMRVPSLVDQIWIKAKRIRTLQENGEQKVKDVGDDVQSEFIGIYNYAIMTLIQSEKSPDLDPKESAEKILQLYDTQLRLIKELMQKKNHDYGEAWRDLRISSITDLILQKLCRINQIIDNDGKTQFSEGIASGLQDIVNYSIFALIKISEVE